MVGSRQVEGEMTSGSPWVSGSCDRYLVCGALGVDKACCHRDRFAEILILEDLGVGHQMGMKSLLDDSEDLWCLLGGRLVVHV